MSTRNLALSGVLCALCSMCIIFSSLFHVIFPLVIACVFFYVCACKCGNACAVIVIFASNIIGFIIGGVGDGEILFSVLLFSPYAMIVFLTRPLDKGVKALIRILIFAAFSFAVFMLFATVLKDLVDMSDDFGLGIYLFGAVWTAVFTAFGFILARGSEIIMKRFMKND